MSKDLMPGETVVLKAHQHWITRVKLISLGVALVILVALADYLLTTVSRQYRLIALLIALAVLGLIAIVSWIQWGSRTFTITDRRVILDAGVFSRTSKVIALDRVQDISVNQSLLGRILGYGKVEIDSAGAAGAEILAAIARPQRFRDEVFVRAEKMRAAAAEPGTDEAPAPQAT
jgi:uncharacterized membrane protein YdbT with pleckstrin-like domain